MSSIDNLRSLLNYQISDGRKKVNVYINDSNTTEINAFILLYNNENEILQIGKHTQAGYYTTGIQIVSRHRNYDAARDNAFKALQYISANRKTIQGVYWIPTEPPLYTGIDERTGGYTFSFNILMKGAS